jgi:undecaprenyl-diphosphatase
MQTLTDIDRSVLAFFNGSDSLFVDNLAVILTSGLTWIPLYLSLLYVVIKNNDTMKQIMLVVGCVILSIILSDGMADFIVKPMVERLRPSNDPFIKYTVNVVNDMRGSSYSFFSAHASNTFCVAMFFSLLVRNKVFVITMVSWSLVNCWTRMYLGLHYPSDILAGLVWGGISGSLAYYVYIKSYLHIYKDFNYISSRYTSTGYNRFDADIVLLVLILTLLFAITKALII